MFAVYADKFSSDDPLSGLVVGERPDPVAPDGLGDGHRQGRLAEPPRPLVAARRGAPRGGAADDPGLRRRGVRRGRQRGGRARRHQRPRLEGRRDLRPEALAALREVPGHVRGPGGRPAPEPGPQAPVADVRGGRLPADRVAHGVPDAVHAGRSQGRRHRAGPGRRRGCRDRADHAGPRRGPAGAGDQPGRGQASPGAGDRRARGLRVRCAAAGQGRRGDGDRRPGHLVALDPVAAPRRRHRDLRDDVRAEARRRRADPDLLPPAAGDRLDDGHAQRAGGAGDACSTPPAPGR